MRYSIFWLESAVTKTGKAVKNATLKTENGTLIEKVSIWSNFPSYESLMPGSTVEGEIITNEKGYRSLKALTPYKAPSGAVSAAKITSESVEKAQVKKNDSIAYFNSLNSALTILGILGEKGLAEDILKGRTQETQAIITDWRDWFLSEWRKYDSGDTTDKSRPF